jgi:hypothetical protein
MSPTKVQARISADPSDIGGFDTVTLYGHALTDEFQTISVEDDVLAKLEGNPHVEVKTPRKAKAEDPVMEPAPEPQV